MVNNKLGNKIILSSHFFQFNAFRRGFEVVTDNSPLPDLFRPEELEQLVIGQRKYDWETLEEICEYDGDFNKNHGTIKNVRRKIVFYILVNNLILVLVSF